MAKRLSTSSWLPLLALLACSAPEPETEAVEAAPPVVRTADAAAKGLTAADFPRVRELAPDVYTYEYLRPAETGGTTNSLFVVTTEGVLVADGQGSVEETQRMIDEIAKVTDQPITHVVVCSDHGDHTGGNSVFPESATFIAHPTSAAVLEASANAPDRAADAPPVRVATEVVSDSLVLMLGGKEIRIEHLGRAHTGGDLAVYLPAEKVLFLSEIFFNRLFPSMRTAYPTEWVGVIERAQAMDADFLIPGHGFVDPPAVLEEELEAYKQATIAVIAETTRLHGTGVSADSALVLANFGEYETWAGRDRQAERAVPRIYMELNGELR